VIAVIADDLTGAAELAGAAASFGLSAEVHTSFRPESGADVIAIDSDTRGKRIRAIDNPASEAQAIVGCTCRRLRKNGGNAGRDALTMLVVSAAHQKEAFARCRAFFHDHHGGNGIVEAIAFEVRVAHLGVRGFKSWRGCGI